MENLIPKAKTVIEEKKQEEQQQKKLMTGKYFKGLKLWAYDPLKKELYQVKIDVVTDYDFTGKKHQAQRKATLNQSHLHIWALNEKNARRKLKL